MNIMKACTLFVSFVVAKMVYSYNSYSKYYNPVDNKDQDKKVIVLK